MEIFRTHHLPGRTLTTENGDEYLYFSGTDYLGMGQNEALRNYLTEGIARYGNHYGSSRNNSLRLGVYEQAEKALSEFTGAQAALLVSSGMWAGQLVMKEIERLSKADKNSQIKYHYAPRVHPALWGNTYQPNTVNWQIWAENTVNEINQSDHDTTHVVCSDVVGSPWVEEYNFTIFHQLADTTNAWLIVDESHGLGVSGQLGKGIFNDLRKSKAKIIVTSSLNKAMGIPAGAIYGHQDVIDQLRSSPWYAGASPSPPAYIFAFEKLLANNVYTDAREALLTNIQYLHQNLRTEKLFNSITDYPVFCSRETKLFGHLISNGIFTSCFSYPSPTDAAVTRLAISSLHKKTDLDRLAEICMMF